MTGVGIVGIGFMGMIHYLAAGRVAGARVAAICSRDAKKRAGDWSGIRGNFGPPGGPVDLSGVKAYAEVDELLADPGVDLVDLCVPNDEHARLAIRALEAGKHVLVEKPIALGLDEAGAMVSAARKADRRLMVAHVLPFFPEFAFAREAVASGRFGGLKAAQFKRVIAKPDWSSGIADADRSGGPAIDLHIHDTHFVGLVAGPPRAVRSRGVVEGGAVVHLDTQYLYGEGGPAVSCVSGALGQPGRPFVHGFEIYLEGAMLAYESGTTPLSVMLPDGTVEKPALGDGDAIDAFAREIGAAVAAAGGGPAVEELDGDLARRALALCLAEIEAVRTGREVEIR